MSIKKLNTYFSLAIDLFIALFGLNLGHINYITREDSKFSRLGSSSAKTYHVVISSFVFRRTTTKCMLETHVHSNCSAH